MTADPLLERLVGLFDEIGPEGRIPSERELSERWGVSRTALRGRLRMLEAVGALERRGSAGSFVRVMEPGDVATALKIGLSASPLSDAVAFTPVRVALEREAAKLAAGRPNPIELGYIEDAVNKMAEDADPQQLYEADLQFHRYLFLASGDPALIFFSEAVGDLIAASVTERRRRMVAMSTDTFEMVTLHRNILNALKNRDAAEAMRAIDHHFERIDRITLPGDLGSQDSDQSGSSD